mmetsp:Transcript_9686/g.16913  ORF Transcript_9686/g.16913 Transcript_9686/m.16913 type:complete len:328 (+) Transcript_9686:68-1051(+)
MIGSKAPPHSQSTASLSSAWSEGSAGDGSAVGVGGDNIVFDPQDDRPFIKDLLSEHASSIATVRAALQEPDYSNLYDPSLYDDIWILRFVLSHKSEVDAATRAAVATMKFRQEYKLNEMDLRGRIKHLDGVRDAEYTLPHEEKMVSCASKYAAINTLPDVNRGPIEYVYLDKLDMNKLNEICTQEDLKLFLIHFNESVYQVLDTITRRTGRLTKLVKVCDMNGTSLRKMSRGYLSKDGAASKEIDDFFPQLLGGLLILHAPKWINVIWKFCRPLLPKRVVEKIDFVPNGKEKIRGSLARFVSKDNLLEMYGGDNKEWPPKYLGSHFR